MTFTFVKAHLQNTVWYDFTYYIYMHMGWRFSAQGGILTKIRIFSWGKPMHVEKYMLQQRYYIYMNLFPSI